MTGGRQRGQTIVIFALAMFAIAGLVAISVDYGFLTNQHRNFQAYTDEAAAAGALQLPAGVTLSDRQNARRVAFQYLRDNLLAGNAGTISSTSFTCSSGPPKTIDFTQDIKDCTLPPPLSAYTISIQTPATTPPSISVPNQYWTMGVTVTESVSTSFAAAVGIPNSQVGASAIALNNHDQNFPDALYSNGCVQTGNGLETIGGTVFVNSCALQTQSAGASAFCVEDSPGSPGNILFGPSAQTPVSPLTGLSTVLTMATVPTCQAGTGGQILTTGTSGGTTQALPNMAPPPPSPDSCFYTSICPVASANVTCNPKIFPAPTAKPCFSPGSYSTIGPIANNLNPGVYYITGPSSCSQGSQTILPNTTGSSVPPCNGVLYQDNSLNANWPDTADGCWGGANNPSTNTFVKPCIDGYTFDPTAPVDPQCPQVATLALPAFTLVGSATGGALDPTTGLSTGTNYWVAVTAIGANGGETTSTEQQVNVNSQGLNKGSIAVTITPVAGATGYSIYVGTASGKEVYSGTATAPTYLIQTQPTTGTSPPRLNTSGNVPLSPPTVSATATTPASPSALATGSYYAMVTAVNNYGETLPQEVGPVVLVGGQTVHLAITPQPGILGYWVYGLSTSSKNELLYPSVTSPTLAPTAPGLAPPTTIDLGQTSQAAVPAAGITGYPPSVNRSGCPKTGFFNQPARPDEYDGVTFVLKNNASVCLNVTNAGGLPSCAASNGVGNNTPTVLFSPATAIPGACNPAAGDGAYSIYSYGAGLISAQGLNTKLGMTGTIYAPSMGLQITQNAQFALYGQAILGQVSIQTGNLKNPSIYYGGKCLAVQKSGVRIIQ
ncbi:MAG: pilus assembly protein TadG-related protein [Candidatus Dormibacteria bacterium]